MRLKLCFFTSLLLLILAGSNAVFAAIVIEQLIAVSNDDGEDHIAYAGQADDGAEGLGSSDLEMPWEDGIRSSSYQVIGMRFTDIQILKGSEVVNAYVQFTADDNDDGKLTGGPAVVHHDDPSAAQIDAWIEWVILLRSFADKGIDLTDVDRIAIGLGTRGNLTRPGGKGVMFIDDIGLYRTRTAQ